jgi:hypothetical protein
VTAVVVGEGGRNYVNLVSLPITTVVHPRDDVIQNLVQIEVLSIIVIIVVAIIKM